MKTKNLIFQNNLALQTWYLEKRISCGKILAKLIWFKSGRMETFYCIFLCKKEIDSGPKSGRKTERALGPAEVCFSTFVPFVHRCQNRFGTTSHNHTHKKRNSSNSGGLFVGWHDHSLRIQPSPGLQSPERRRFEVLADDAELSAHL